jgi:hypothetical protein
MKKHGMGNDLPLEKPGMSVFLFGQHLRHDSDKKFHASH